MSDPLDVHRNLEHCMQTIQAGRVTHVMCHRLAASLDGLHA
jgi:hypothetical protein